MEFKDEKGNAGNVNETSKTVPQPQVDKIEHKPGRRNKGLNPMSNTDRIKSKQRRNKQEPAHASGISLEESNDSTNQKQSMKETKKQIHNNNKRNHFTRSRYSKSSASIRSKHEEKSNSKLILSSDNHSDLNKPNISMNACASMLAELDSVSYHQSLIRDANNLTQQILLPLSLPWTHKVTPVARNIPCDIDEMIDIVTADDGSHTPFENGNFGYGQYETGRLRSGDSLIRLANSSDNFRAASRRSTDPGIINFSTVALPPIPIVRTPLSIDSSGYHDDDQEMKESSLLRCFEATKQFKRRKVEHARTFVTSYEISVKINSSSSRSSIFASGSNKRKINEDWMLEAILPLEVEKGRQMAKTRAKIAKVELGSYDILHGHDPVQCRKNSNRALVGRTRLMWTGKQSSEQHPRFSFASLVTGQKLGIGAEKRPRNVRVRIKVDGKICDDRMTTFNKKRCDGMNIQTSLHCGKLVRNLLDGRNDKANLSFTVPPAIECIPDSTGSVHVVCTSLGSILSSSINQILKVAQKKSKRCCTVCWRSTEGGSMVHECVKCGLLAHIDCCLDPGDLKVVSIARTNSTKTEWTCSVCCHDEKNRFETQKITGIKKSKRKSRPPSKLKDAHFQSFQPQECNQTPVGKKKEVKCAICLLSGGAMSRISDENEEFWVHETCRIWTSGQRPYSNYMSQSCVICGTSGAQSVGSRSKKENVLQYSRRKTYSSKCLVKCAAAGCHVFVHPMCALVSTLESQSTNQAHAEYSESAVLENIQKAKKKDMELCSQYTFTFASICGSTRSFGSKPGARCETSLPIIFCGIHNPAREQSFYGLCPGGKSMDTGQTIKVPSY